MSKKIKSILSFSSFAILMSGCSGMSIKDVSDSANSLDASFDEVINTHKQLVDYESKLNEQFEELLAKDSDLASIEDKSADVVKNIIERETLLENIKAQSKNINEQAELLTTYNGEDFSTDEIQKLADEFTSFTTHLDAFNDAYGSSLETQRTYLNQIAAENSNYEDFIEGINSVNTDYMALQESTITFDHQLVNFGQNLLTLQERITVANNDDDDTEEQNETGNDSDSETESPADKEGKLLAINTEPLLNIPNKFPQKFVYDSGVDIPYPEEGVKGIFVTAHSAGGEKMDYLTNLINTTDLNAMVIDVKDDHGNVTLQLNSDNELVNEMTSELINAEDLMKHLQENNIYPIARIVVFKDSLLAKAKPEWSFTHSNGEVWSNRRGESFVNPYLKEVWDYNIEIAVQAAKLGFKDIQFDYVRFPEGFETRDRELVYGHGHYGSDNADVINMEYRNQAVTEFVATAKEQLKPYGADLSVDIFGYAAVVRETPGIGQSFPGIAKEVDVISSMIYPSHWGLGNLDVAVPDLNPYQTVYNYSIIENEIMDELGDDAPISRPWIQDFTASYLGAGYYKNYGAQEVTDQIRALNENGINEFLLWNAGNTYSEGAKYTFE